jgi:outer membrane beta-barrel protein
MSMNTASKMKSRFAAALAAGCAFLALSGHAQAQEEQEQVTGPLAGAPAVRQLRLYRKGRVELAPQVAFTLLDEYQRTMFTGATLNYHFADWIGLGAWGAYGALKMPTALSENIQSKANEGRGCRTAPTDPDAANACDLIAVNMGEDFTEQLGDMNWVVAPQLTIIPFRGKLGLFNSVFVDSDLYFFAGPAFVGVEERKDCESGCGDLSAFGRQSRTAIAPTFGLGFSFYLSKWAALGAEWRAMPFSWNTGGLDTGGSGPDEAFPDAKINDKDRQFHLNSMIGLSFNMFLPTQYQVSE